MSSALLPGGDYLERVRAIVAAHGWAVQNMCEPPMTEHAYTVGMTGLGAPEVLIVGLPGHDAAAVLNRIAPLIMSGQVAIGSHVIVGVGAGVRRAHTVIHTGGLCMVAAALYGASSVRAVELVLEAGGDVSGPGLNRGV